MVRKGMKSVYKMMSYFREHLALDVIDRFDAVSFTLYAFAQCVGNIVTFLFFGDWDQRLEMYSLRMFTLALLVDDYTRVSGHVLKTGIVFSD